MSQKQNKQLLIDAIKNVTITTNPQGELTTNAANRIVNTIFETITENLKEEGDSITLVGFGTFHVVKTKERNARNIQTGESIVVPEKLRIKFKPGKNLKL